MLMREISKLKASLEQLKQTVQTWKKVWPKLHKRIVFLASQSQTCLSCGTT